MIKVIDEVTGTAIKIEVVGRPYQYQFKAGKVGTWKVARGRTAGQVKTGEKWGRSIYVRSLKMGLEAALEAVSEEEDLLTIDNLAHADVWKQLIDLEETRIRMIDAIEKEYGQLVETNGAALATITKKVAGKKVKMEDDEEPEDEDVEDEDEE